MQRGERRLQLELGAGSARSRRPGARGARPAAFIGDTAGSVRELKLPDRADHVFRSPGLLDSHFALLL